MRNDLELSVTLARTVPELPEDTMLAGAGPDDHLPDPVGVEVSGRPATVRTVEGWRHGEGTGPNLYVFTWQPADGFWARAEMQTTSLDQALDHLGKVRFDQTRRCLLAIRPGHLPTGMSVVERIVSLQTDPVQGLRVSSDFTISGGGRELSLRTSDYANRTRLTTTREPNFVSEDETGNDWTMAYGGRAISVSNPHRDGAFSKEEVMRIVDGLRFADRIDDPRTW
ncbi:hypothetical protein ACIA8K_29535 [Catenuloplanes sp. NPDC051500]|uniref:hypothetical protein n=1 Tax=Catenuloplanes sp. NPDC051500 TaxID=3363959 RepID=UPI0037A461FF